MERLYPLERLPAGADAVALAKVMTQNIKLMQKNMTILNDEIITLREDNEMLQRRLAGALAAITDFQKERRKQKDEIARLLTDATGESAGFSE